MEVFGYLILAHEFKFIKINFNPTITIQYLHHIINLHLLFNIILQF